MTITPITLTGHWARLEPLAKRHAPDLFQVSQDEEIWQYLPYPMPHTADEMCGWVSSVQQLQARGQVLPFAIVDQATGQAVGSTRYMDISEQDRHVEIGGTWLGRAYWRTPINTECKYLLLKHAFEELGCIRVQLKTDLRNVRSQRAIERLGAVREGILRQAMIVKANYARSSVYYSILEDEWPAVKARLEALLH